MRILLRSVVMFIHRAIHRVRAANESIRMPRTCFPTHGAAMSVAGFAAVRWMAARASAAWMPCG